MSREICASVKREQFSFEMMLHRSGLANLDKPCVLVFQKALICLDCGFFAVYRS
jgi:hypothetical protein